MRLGEKLRYLRTVEGMVREMGREMTQQEVVAGIRKELKQSLSQSYLSQIESGARPHLTNTSRQLLAKFFKVHPGFLVDDPEGFHMELVSDLRGAEGKLDAWLLEGAERFRGDEQLSRALFAVAEQKDSRAALLLLSEILNTPNLGARLAEVLKVQAQAVGAPGTREGK
jgi:transcriptional regulator with XRE-family HTH domain